MAAAKKKKRGPYKKRAKPVVVEVKKTTTKSKHSSDHISAKIEIVGDEIVIRLPRQAFAMNLISEVFGVPAPGK